MNHRKQEIDAKLASPAQQAVRELVRGLPEDAPSMAWRSALNEKILETAARQKRRHRVAIWLRPAFGLGFAGALALFVVMRAPIGHRPMAANPPQATIEAALVKAHTESTQFVDVTGAGLNPIEVAYGATSGPGNAPEWSEVDAEAL